jgi:hypothetical protein
MIDQSDVFVFLDDFQFCPRSWHQRNRLLVGRDMAGWYTVPVSKKAGSRQPMNAMPLADTEWRQPLWRKLVTNYSKTPFFDVVAPVVESWMAQESGTLAQFDIAFIRRACALMGIETAFTLSSDVGVQGHRSERILGLLRENGATRYLSARGSFEYMMQDGVFPAEGIEAVFLEFEPVPYPQVDVSKFTSYLSVLDALMNVGPTETLQLIRAGTTGWTGWSDMVAVPRREAPA